MNRNRRPAAESPARPSDNLFSVFFSVAILALFAIAILSGLSRPTHAASEGRYVCAAKIDCGAPSFPSTQDLPSESTPTVRSADAESARAKCSARYETSYARLAKSLERRDAEPSSLFRAAHGCRVASEALGLAAVSGAKTR